MSVRRWPSTSPAFAAPNPPHIQSSSAAAEAFETVHVTAYDRALGVVALPPVLFSNDPPPGTATHPFAGSAGSKDHMSPRNTSEEPPKR
jgi:hypothetical protein